MHALCLLPALRNRQYRRSDAHQYGSNHPAGAALLLALALASTLPGCGADVSVRRDAGRFDDDVGKVDDQAEASVIPIGQDSTSASTPGDASVARSVPFDADKVEVCARLVAEWPAASDAGSVLCEYALQLDAEGYSRLHVIIDGQELKREEGWSKQGQKLVLEAACDRLRTPAAHRVEIHEDCEHPIAL